MKRKISGFYWKREGSLLNPEHKDLYDTKIINEERRKKFLIEKHKKSFLSLLARYEVRGGRKPQIPKELSAIVGKYKNEFSYAHHQRDYMKLIEYEKSLLNGDRIKFYKVASDCRGRGKKIPNPPQKLEFEIRSSGGVHKWLMEYEAQKENHIKTIKLSEMPEYLKKQAPRKKLSEKKNGKLTRKKAKKKKKRKIRKLRNKT